jgi:hypothetical protein
MSDEQQKRDDEVEAHAQEIEPEETEDEESEVEAHHGGGWKHNK